MRKKTKKKSRSSIVLTRLRTENEKLKRDVKYEEQTRERAEANLRASQEDMIKMRVAVDHLLVGSGPFLALRLEVSQLKAIIEDYTAYFSA